jgi:hypothetical protein
MLTLFAIPKAFHGHVGVIQQNAIGSWARLGRGSRVVLFGADEGTAEVARQVGVEHEPEVARNEFGTPLVSDLFRRAHELTRHDVLCYVNSDVILLDDFSSAVDEVRRLGRPFLMIGQCWNLDVPTPVVFDPAVWQAELARAVSRRGTRRGKWFIDYFVFSRDIYEALPPFAVGRAGFDNWLVWKACEVGAAVVDASAVVTAVHQNHEYGHVPGGRKWSYLGPEAKRNHELAGGIARLYHIGDATHRLTPRGLRRRRWVWPPRGSRAAAWQLALRTRLGPAAWRVVEATRPLRHRLGLRPAVVERLRFLIRRRWTGGSAQR